MIALGCLRLAPRVAPLPGPESFERTEQHDVGESGSVARPMPWHRYQIGEPRRCDSFRGRSVTVRNTRNTKRNTIHIAHIPIIGVR